MVDYWLLTTGYWLLHYWLIKLNVRKQKPFRVREKSWTLNRITTLFFNDRFFKKLKVTCRNILWAVLPWACWAAGEPAGGVWTWTCRDILFTALEESQAATKPLPKNYITHRDLSTSPPLHHVGAATADKLSVDTNIAPVIPCLAHSFNL